MQLLTKKVTVLVNDETDLESILLLKHFSFKLAVDLYYDVAIGKIDPLEIKAISTEPFKLFRSRDYRLYRYNTSNIKNDNLRQSSDKLFESLLDFYRND